MKANEARIHDVKPIVKNPNLAIFNTLMEIRYGINAGSLFLILYLEAF